MLRLIRAHPAQLEFAGFMGYDPFVGMGVPEIVATPQTLLARVMAIYRARVDFVRLRYPDLWRPGLTLNTVPAAPATASTNRKT